MSLKELRVQGDPTQLAKLEPHILQALREVEAGNERLGKLMSRLVDEGAEFEGLMNSAQGLMTTLGRGLRGIARGRRAHRDRERGARSGHSRRRRTRRCSTLSSRATPWSASATSIGNSCKRLGWRRSRATRRVEAVETADDGIELF